MVPTYSVRIPRVPTYSLYPPQNLFAYKTVTLCRAAFQLLRLRFLRIMIPGPYFYSPFGLLRVRSPLLTESFLLSFPPGTKMFQFPGFPSHTLCVQVWIIRYYPYWVPSFGDLRITGYLLLPAAFRSLSRPSSAPCTKASTSMLFVAWSFSSSFLAFFRFFWVYFLLLQKFYEL